MAWDGMGCSGSGMLELIYVYCVLLRKVCEVTFGDLGMMGEGGGLSRLDDGSRWFFL